MNVARLIKFTFMLGLAAVLTSGCTTTKSIEAAREQRKQERYAVYTQLSPEFKSLVDKGNIQIGMPMDAVYIAWGKPSQTMVGETPQGKVVTWIYENTYLQGVHYWGYRGYYGRRGVYGGPRLETDYYPQNYVQAEVTFEKGLVRDWRTMPHPN